MPGEVFGNTHSVCPVCLKRLLAERVRIGAVVFLLKICEEHGPFEAILWRGHADLNAWLGGRRHESDGNPRCPCDCGLCPDHLQETCCVLLEVTRRCDLNCRFCFANGGGKKEPPFAQVKSWLFKLAEPGKTFVQLSGGEPTMRDDLPEIVAAAKEAGCRYVQLNSNGIRLAEDPAYVHALAAAGLSFVFMQFDGTDDAIYWHLRGRSLLRTKQSAIENCAAQNIGVTLVPMLVPGVNTGNIGDILEYGITHAPAVRGVHFQPVSYFGRMPAIPTDDMRLTLDQLLFEIEKQTHGIIKAENLVPSSCDHPFCGFHGDFIVTPGGYLAPLSRRGKIETGCCAGPKAAERNREFIARRWQRPLRSTEGSCGADMHDMGSFLQRVKSHGFTVTAMAFQDAGNLDLERLRRCSLHVFDNGRLVPFCAYYLSAWEPCRKEGS